MVTLSMLMSTHGCDREPGIVVNIAAWPEGAERIRVRTKIADVMGTDFFIKKEQTRFTVRVPAGSQGPVYLEGVGLDAVNCKLARGSLTEPVPDNLSRFVERTLELLPLPSHECIFGTVTGTVTPFSVGMTPAAVIVGDFNNDKKSDLAVANSYPMNSNVSVLLGTGRGNFGPASNFFPGGAGARGIAVGDFNGDMQPDLAVANYWSDSVGVLLGDKLIGFRDAIPFTVGKYPVFAAVGDFDGDSKLDLVVVNSSIETNNISLLLGDGSGGFSMAKNFAVGGRSPQSVAVGDFNGDAKPDLAVANLHPAAGASTYTVSVLLNDDRGGFNIARDFAVGKNPVSVAVGDFNGDTKPDLVVANLMSNDVSVLLGGIWGSFEAATSYAVGVNPYSVAVGDFDGDDKLDLVTANQGSNNVSVLLGDGQGKFGPATNFLVGMEPVSVAVGDFDGNMKPDLAVANQKSNDVSVLLNNFFD